MKVYSFVVPPKAKARGFAVADLGYADAFESADDLTAAELAVFCERNAAVAGWLPAESFATVSVMHFEDKRSCNSQFQFNVKMCDCIDLYEEGKATAIGDGVEDLAAAKRQYWVICKGTMQSIKCDPGYKGACVGGEVKCVVGAPG